MTKAIAIDLDDTLLDTSGILAPKATRDAFSNLIQFGLSLTLEQCEVYRAKWVKSLSHREVFEKMALEFGTERTVKNVKAAIKVFYEPAIPQSLPLIEGAQANLDYLKGRYSLFLVTAGETESQLAKVRALGIEKYFERVFVVNSLLNYRKMDAFLEIITQLQINPTDLLCIGNSLLSEIHDALKINAQACYFEFGEERGTLTQLPKLPDFHIRHHSELITTCKL